MSGSLSLASMKCRVCHNATMCDEIFIQTPDDEVSSVGAPMEGIIEWSDGTVGSMVSPCDSEGSSAVLHVSGGEELFDVDSLNSITGVEVDKLSLMEFSNTLFGSLVDRTCSVSPDIFDECDDDMSVEPLHFPSSPIRPNCKQLLNIKRTIRSLRVDRFSSLPDEVLTEIFSCLDVTSLSSMRLLSKRSKAQSSRDEAGWDMHCTRLWKEKLHISWVAKQTRDARNALQAYRISAKDAKSRQEISPEELCFDAVSGAGTVWHFRFKESAGSSWTSFDPWHAGLPCRKMVFLRDGSVQELVAGPFSKFRIDDPFRDAPNHDQQDNASIVDGSSPITMKWRFLLSPMDTPSRPRGAYIRLNVGGRDVPTYIVQRSPTGNWGFVMENCWGIFASFPLPRKTDTGLRQPLHPTRMCLRRTSDGGVRWLNVEGIESDGEEEDMELDNETSSTSDERLLGDRALPTTSRRQWREALLYNYGSTTLPEGEAARAEFDRIFDSFRLPIQSLDNMVR